MRRQPEGEDVTIALSDKLQCRKSTIESPCGTVEYLKAGRKENPENASESVRWKRRGGRGKCNRIAVVLGGSRREWVGSTSELM